MQRVTSFKTFDRSLGASPAYHFDIGESSVTIPVGQKYSYSFFDSQPAAQKYTPFNSVSVSNTSGSDVIFYPGQGSDGWLINNNTVKLFKATDIPALVSFSIKNNGASSISSGLRVEVANNAASTEYLGQKIVEKIGGVLHL